MITTSPLHALKDLPAELSLKILVHVIKSYHILEIIELLKDGSWAFILKYVFQRSEFYILQYHINTHHENRYLKLKSVDGMIFVGSPEFKELARYLQLYDITPFELCFREVDYYNFVQPYKRDTNCGAPLDETLEEFIDQFQRVTPVLSWSRSGCSELCNIKRCSQVTECSLYCDFFDEYHADSTENVKDAQFKTLKVLTLNLYNNSDILDCIRLLKSSVTSANSSFSVVFPKLKKIMLHFPYFYNYRSYGVESLFLHLAECIDEFESHYEIPVSIQAEKLFSDLNSDNEPLLIKYFSDHITNYGRIDDQTNGMCTEYVKWIHRCSNLKSMILSPPNSTLISSEGILGISNTLKTLHITEYDMMRNQKFQFPWKEFRELTLLTITHCLLPVNFLNEFNTLPKLSKFEACGFLNPSFKPLSVALPKSLKYLRWDSSNAPVIRTPYPTQLQELAFTMIPNRSCPKIPNMPINRLILSSRCCPFLLSQQTKVLKEVDDFELMMNGFDICDLAFLPPNIKSLKINLSEYSHLFNQFPESLVHLEVELGNPYGLNLLSEAAKCWNVSSLVVKSSGCKTLDFSAINLNKLYSIIVDNDPRQFDYIKIGDIPESLFCFKFLVGRQDSFPSPLPKINLLVPKITSKMKTLGIFKTCSVV